MQKFVTHLLTSAFFLWMLSPAIALAACTTTITTSMYQNPISEALKICSIPDLLLALVNLVFLIGVPIVVVCLIYSGFLFVSAQDNESELTKAKTVFLWTVIGALVLFGAKAIALAIQETILSLG